MIGSVRPEVSIAFGHFAGFFDFRELFASTADTEVHVALSVALVCTISFVTGTISVLFETG